MDTVICVMYFCKTVVGVSQSVGRLMGIFNRFAQFALIHWGLGVGVGLHNLF